MPKVAVIGGGINGLCSAWQLALAGAEVTVFERDELLSQTSSASSKLLHGGLRYLEHFEFRLVKEALAERQWWLEHAPNATRRLPILYPLYAHTRPRWKLKLGFMLYDLLAGKKGIGRHRWLTPKQVRRCSPQLKQQGLLGAYLYHDGQMDDIALGQWVINQCQKLGVVLHTQHHVSYCDANGKLVVNQQTLNFDHIVNAGGPWSEQLLTNSQQPHDVTLDLVRGSHLLLPSISKFGHFLEVPGESRLVFVLPYKGQTLLGTTEVAQSLQDPIACSEDERSYLLKLYNHYFSQTVTNSDILAEFAGVRPLIASDGSLSSHSREYKLLLQGKLLTVFGGKWTTARALGKAVSNTLLP
ncbi:FAD-dependent oxidoreductase [Pseudoalteromonas fenneropenaei]|uniref:FAD-dependent oxidoreductase n=1 Tax=Pseudoalteromonas fenneropenaei TaxID=1737459 RepID=A0ABV7CJN9_9GAMM